MKISFSQSRGLVLEVEVGVEHHYTWRLLVLLVQVGLRSRPDRDDGEEEKCRDCMEGIDEDV